MEKILKIFTSALLIISLSTFFLTSCDNDQEHVYYTDDINDYLSEEYAIGSGFFLGEKPDYATVKRFVYYSYWSEVRDHYLELTFDSREDMDKYLAQIVSAVERRALKNNIRKPIQGWYVEEENPYDSSYTDWIFTTWLICIGDEKLTGYSVRADADRGNHVLSANAEIISFSYNDLTIVQTRMFGSFETLAIDHRFEYFKRFNIPVDESFEKYVYLDYSEG